VQPSTRGADGVRVLSTWRKVALPVAAALAFRYACYVAMIAMCLWAEARPAPHLPDLVIDRVPYVAWVDRENYVILLACFVPPSVALLVASPLRFCRYTMTAGMLDLLRGACITLTGLGPVNGADVNAGMSGAERLRALASLVTPASAWSGAPHVYLTKDLFFSGHVGATFLLLLYVWQNPRLRVWALAGHLVVVASVALAHLHYSIDVVGAWAVAAALFAVREMRRGARDPVSRSTDTSRASPPPP
jgi:PAP2 superfamily C-terminal